MGCGFPEGFWWGAGTSAHQVEGGNDNDWSRFELEPGVIRDGRLSGAACRHYEKFDEDFALAAADGHCMHRLSFEWSRIEPARGRFAPVAVAHYHAVLASLRRRGLTPLVTLHHFTNPLWIAERGGWENPDTIARFCEFARFCAREFGGEVDWWCTVNEPEVLGFRGWSEGIWPPQKRDDSAALVVIANLLEAHGRAYRVLHDEDRADADGDGRSAVVGFAKHWVGLAPDRPWFAPDALRAWFEDRVFNRAVIDAPVSGRIALSIPGARGIARRVPELEGSCDYIGLNVYTRWRVRTFAREVHVASRGAPLTDLGWEVAPGVIAQGVRAVTAARVPILVTEHGFADAKDALRPRALVDSLLRLGRVIEQGANVIGYLHWSLLDNFEWADGYTGRFGLYAVDFDDPERPRRRRRSADLLARIARANGIDESVAAEAGLVL
jgi:beta-glucosidase